MRKLIMSTIIIIFFGGAAAQAQQQLPPTPTPLPNPFAGETIQQDGMQAMSQVNGDETDTGYSAFNSLSDPASLPALHDAKFIWPVAPDIVQLYNSANQTNIMTVAQVTMIVIMVAAGARLLITGLTKITKRDL